ncbi:hypothetical protein Bca4012_008814 [Brassica carinata]
MADNMNFRIIQEAYMAGKHASEDRYKAILVMYKDQTRALFAKHDEAFEVCRIEAKLELVEKLIHLEALKAERAKLEADLEVAHAKVDDVRVPHIDWFKLGEPNMYD